MKFQKDSVALSEVYECFESLPLEFETNEYLSEMEKAYLKKLALDRWNFCYSDAHGVSYLLDPRFTGARMDLDLKEKVLEFVSELSQVSGEELEEEKNIAVVMEYDNFFNFCERQRQRPVKGRFWNMLMNGQRSVSYFWFSDGKEWPRLQKIALQVFSLSPSSASSERNFSSEGFIHSKRRNRLGKEKVAKLNFIRTNQALFDEYSAKELVEINDQSDIDESDHSDDDVITLDDLEE